MKKRGGAKAIPGVLMLSTKRQFAPLPIEHFKSDITRLYLGWNRYLHDKGVSDLIDKHVIPKHVRDRRGVLVPVDDTPNDKEAAELLPQTWVSTKRETKQMPARRRRIPRTK